MMIPHDCLQDERIRDITKRIDKLEERVDTMREDLKEIKNQNNKLLWAVIGVLLTSLGTLVLLILKMKGIG